MGKTITTKNAKQLYRSAKKQLPDGFKMEPFKEWVRGKFRKGAGSDFELCPKLIKIVFGS